MSSSESPIFGQTSRHRFILFPAFLSSIFVSYPLLVTRHPDCDLQLFCRVTVGPIFEQGLQTANAVNLPVGRRQQDGHRLL